MSDFLDTLWWLARGLTWLWVFSVALVVAALLVGLAYDGLAYDGLAGARDRVDQLRARQDEQTAADFGEPIREAVERLMDGDEWASENGWTRAGAERLFAAVGELDEQTEDWIFPHESFMDSALRRQDSVLFAAAVLADIDELTGGGAA